MSSDQKNLAQLRKKEYPYHGQLQESHLESHLDPI